MDDAAENKTTDKEKMHTYEHFTSQYLFLLSSTL